MKRIIQLRAGLLIICCLGNGISSWATLADYQQAVTNEATLISYYTFDKSNAVDVFGSNNGTLQGTATFAEGIGTVGKSVALNGSGRVNLGSVLTGQFTNDPILELLAVQGYSDPVGSGPDFHQTLTYTVEVGRDEVIHP